MRTGLLVIVTVFWEIIELTVRKKKNTKGKPEIISCSKVRDENLERQNGERKMDPVKERSALSLHERDISWGD